MTQLKICRIDDEIRRYRHDTGPVNLRKSCGRFVYKRAEMRL